MNTNKKIFISLLITAFFLFGSASILIANQFISYQGMLANGGGAPVNNEVAITFRLWDDIVKSTNQLWEEQQQVKVVDGVFSIQLGRNTPLPPADVFTNPELYLEISIDGVALTPRTHLNITPSAFWAEKSGNSATLAGHGSGYFAPSSHTHPYTEITGNTEYIDTRIAELEARIDTQQQQIDLLLQTLEPEELTQLSTEFNQISTRVEQLEISVENRDVLDELVSFLSVSGTDIILTGANLNILNGTGRTDSVNGTGNLIIGYNASRDDGNQRAGSHNLIVGDLNDYTSYGGLVAGKENSIQAPYGSITGGTLGMVQAELGTISGGYENNVKGMYGTVAGGVKNLITTDSLAGSILGGMENESHGQFSSIAGGYKNQTDGDASVILGGTRNIATGENSAVLGGLRNTAQGDEGVVLGGKDQVIAQGQDIGPLVSPFGEVMTLSGDTLRISGVNVQIVNGAGSTQSLNGRGNLILGYNLQPASGYVQGGRNGSHNVILGDLNNYDASSGLAIGYYNYLGSAGIAAGVANSITAPSLDTGMPGIATVVGGAVNHATGSLSSMVGGRENDASGMYSVVLGGRDNVASGERATVSGGDKNEAGGVDSTVGGGMHNRAMLDKSAVPTGRYLTEGN